MIAKRVLLFLLTNLAVVAVLGLVLKLLGVDQYLAARGALGGFQGLLVLAALLGFGGSFVSLALSKWIAKTSTGARVIEVPRTPTEAWLLETVARQARAAGIGVPEVAIYDSPEPNAFATGMRSDHALVAVSSGLLRGMHQREAEAVLAHEVSHVANGDMITMALLQGVLNTFVVFLSRLVGFAVDSALSSREGERRSSGYGIGYYLSTILCELAFGVLASVIAMWFSRRREFRADAGAAQLEGPEAMIAALRRLQGGADASRLPGNLAAFGIVGGAGGLLAKLFRSHPPIEERIAALEALLPSRPARRPALSW